MLTDINQLQALLSAIFVFLGATVFFISSLISGRNIFRDISLQLVLLVSMIVGFLLFAFSPISFLVFAPQLFGIQESSELVWTSIQQQIEHYFFWPFILSAVGLGVVIGTLNAINARTLLLRWLRTKTMLNYPILTYDRSWDTFLLSLKSGGAVRLVGKGEHEICAGKLRSFSIREEPRSITVEYGDKLRLVMAEDLKYVEAPRKSFKRHRDAIAHQAEAFYLALAVAGLLMLVASADLTSSYLSALRSFDFGSTAALYRRLAMGLLIVAVLFVWVSFRASRQDFCRLSSYLVLCPSVPRLLLLGSYGILVLFWREVEQLPLQAIDAGLPDVPPWKTLGAGLIAVVAYLSYKKREIRKSLDSEGMSPDLAAARKRELAEVCELIYLETDLNQPGPVRWPDLQSKVRTKEQAVVLKDLCEKVDRLTRTATFLGSRPGQYLMGEEINLVLYLLNTLGKARARASPAQVVHEDAHQQAKAHLQP